MMHLKKLTATVSTGRWHHLCSCLALWVLVVAHDPTDIGGPEVVSGWQCEGTVRL
jgi:hypothetical protein